MAQVSVTAGALMAYSWLTDLNTLRFTKLDFHGNHLSTWLVAKDLPDAAPRARRAGRDERPRVDFHPRR